MPCNNNLWIVSIATPWISGSNKEEQTVHRSKTDQTYIMALWKYSQAEICWFCVDLWGLFMWWILGDLHLCLIFLLNLFFQQHLQDTIINIRSKTLGKICTVHLPAYLAQHTNPLMQLPIPPNHPSINSPIHQSIHYPRWAPSITSPLKNPYEIV